MHQAVDPYPSATQNSSYSTKGFFFNLGFTWEPSPQLILGLSMRPPFSLQVQTEMESTDSAGQRAFFSGDNYFKHPLVAVASPLGRLDLQFAAKLGLSSKEKNRFHSDVFQVGAAYRF